jgi:hypothetical protein
MSQIVDQLSTENLSVNEERYPQRILEQQGNLADRAEIEIEQEIQAKIFLVRQELAKAAGARPQDRRTFGN